MNTLKKTPFVPTAPNQFSCPSQVYDPRNKVFYVVFGDTPCFPTQEFAKPAWLDVLVELGMKTSVDRSTFIECAKQVENSRGKVDVNVLKEKSLVS